MRTRLDADQAASPMAEMGTRHDHAHFEHLRARLRWKLLISYVLALAVLAVYFHFQHEATLREGVNNHLRAMAENRRNTVDLFLQERLTNLRGLFASVSAPESLDGEALQMMLADLKRSSDTFVDLGAFDPAGRLRAYAGPHPELVGKDYSAQAWYLALKDDDKAAHISDLYPGFRQAPHFSVAARKRIGHEDWTLRASVDPRKFGEFVNSSYLLEGVETAIVNAEGKRQALSGKKNQQESFGDVPLRSAETWLSEVEVDGVAHLRAVAWLATTDWAVLVQAPTEAAVARFNPPRQTLVNIGLLALALAIIVGVVLTTTSGLIGRLERADTVKQDLANQLFNAAKLASVGEMAAGVAHEINNPLAIIYEEASLILDLLDPRFEAELTQADLRERLEAIREATMRGRSITRQLLAFARKETTDLVPADLNELVAQALEVKKTTFEVNNIAVALNLAPELPRVLVNRNQMDQVLLNLLNNARDAIGRDGQIRVSTQAVEDAVRLRVQDSGSGMSPEVMAQIFFPFFTTKRVGKGTGLGLSISYGIVKSFGGRIEVESEPGSGTVFTILLPIPDPDRDQQQAAD